MLKRNTNLKILAILALLCGATIPMPSVYAANGWEIDLNAGDEIAEASSVTITMGSGTASAVLFPESSNPSKAMAMIKRTASVVIGATDGYTIKVSGEPDLVGKNANNKIPSITANTTLAQMNNQWGWYSAEGDVDCNTAQSLKQMNSAGETISSGALSAVATKNFTMCFGAKVNTGQAADSYSGTVMVSAVAEPRSLVINKPFNGITTMQAMTSDICKTAAVNDTAQLEDTRDGKKYWVTKMLNGSCWMSQNLALDLSTSKALTSSDSNVTSNWTPPRSTVNISTSNPLSSSNTSTSNTETYSWNLGGYVIIDPTATTGCSYNNTGLSACVSQFVAVGGRAPSTDPNFYKNNGNKTYTDTEYDAHYLVGNYYQWNTATAGAGASVADRGEAGESICPKNWRLPNSNTNTTFTFGSMLGSYGVNGSLVGTSSTDKNTYNIALSPLFFVRGGYVNSYAQQLWNAGSYGVYWSLRAGFDSSNAYGLAINNVNLDSSGFADRFIGRTVRCMIQPTYMDFN